MEAEKIYNKINSLDDLRAYFDVSSSAESSILELKALPEDLNKTSKAGCGDFKLRIAKEMCAFANTDAGVIAIGVDEKYQIVNNTDNLLEWLDDNIRHMLEPQLAGLSMKKCSHENGEEFVLMHIPKGSAIPYRTAAPAKYENKKDIAKEYYQRIGTHSEKIPMPIVRSLYLSNDRITRLSAKGKLISLDRRKHAEEYSLKLGLEVTPDPTKLIKDYFLESKVMLMDRSFNALLDEPEDIGWWSINQPLIPPDNKPNIYNERAFIADNSVSTTNEQTTGLWELTVPAPPLLGADIEIDSRAMENVYAIYIKTSFACEGVPIVEDNRIIITGDHAKLNSESWNKSSGWINDKCEVVRFKSLGEKESDVIYSLENFIETKGLN